MSLQLQFHPLSLTLGNATRFNFGRNIFVDSVWFGGYLFGPLKRDYTVFQPFRGNLLKSLINGMAASLEIYSQTSKIQSVLSGVLSNPCEGCPGKCENFGFGAQCDPNCPQCAVYSDMNIVTGMVLNYSQSHCIFCEFKMFIFFELWNKGKNGIHPKFLSRVMSCLTNPNIFKKF